MLAQLYQSITIVADLVIFLFAGYYLLHFRAKEKELETKEGKIDTDYHQVVDTALAKERKILEDATSEADHIITDAHRTNKAAEDAVNHALQQMVVAVEKEATDTASEITNSNKTSEEAVNQALQQLVTDVQKETTATAHDFTTSYQTLLKQMADQSLHDFQNITKTLESDLQKQMKEFHDTLLPTIEKEVAAYKQARLEQTDKMIAQIIQKVSQEVLNKAISLDDHKTILIDSLEKAKKENFFS